MIFEWLSLKQIKQFFSEGERPTLMEHVQWNMFLFDGKVESIPNISNTSIISQCYIRPEYDQQSGFKAWVRYFLSNFYFFTKW